MMIFALICTFLIVVAAAMTLFWGPGAAGSGVAETIAYINGINYHDFNKVATLVTKIFGVVLAVAGGLKVGKEGPLAHIGSVTGIVMIYLPWGFSDYFKNDKDKRLMVASGAGVGVSVAFGAPIGGTLFAYEVAKETAFWNFSLAWKTFVSTSVANFTLAVLVAIKKGHYTAITNSGLLKFGEMQMHYYGLQDIPMFVVIGAVCGVLGSLFVTGNTFINKHRKRILNTKFKKFMEPICIAFFGAILAYLMPLIFDNSCVSQDESYI